ncbi:unnamed protein product [Mytilus coruscus]|uniref:Chromatin target of PRMT1 protein C-terminal domain-containing protein n=1 Tax=Mytilus coruscus TaxID=42192 RepID=A0A6J8B1P3_MYTCO|nr:unnamed protein product [Mytilus coruscus]
MAVPAKIVLKSTTKMSLNDRFSTIQATVRQPAQQASVSNIRAKMAAQHQATAANKRLAMQMANRPSVQAALKIKKKSLKQRLGFGNTSVKSRLTLGGRGGGAMVRGGRGQGRLMRSRGQMRGRGRGGRGGGGSTPGSPTGNQMVRGGNRGQRGGFVQRGRGQRGGFVQRGGGQRGGFVQRGGGGGGENRGRRGGMQRGRGFQGGNRGGRGQAQGFRGNRGGFRARGGGNNRGRGGFRGGRGQRGRGGDGRSPISKEELDNQLEAYMSKTKSSLDADLDSYMQQN